MDVGRRAALHAGAGSAPCREDIFPGHTQYFAVGRTGGFDLHEAGRDAGNGLLALDGWTFLYDPSGEVECPRGVDRAVGWSPLTTCKSKWDAAVVTADAMIGATRATHAVRVAEEPLERTRRCAALDPHPCCGRCGSLHAGRAPVDRSPRWRSRTRDHLARTPRRHDEADADLLTGIVATDSREQSGIWSTASGVLAAYRTDGVMESTRLPPLDLDSFCAGTNTLYICSSGRRQRQFAARRRRPRRRARCHLRSGPGRTRRRRRPCSPSTRWPTSPPCLICRPWSARAEGRACWCWPACRTSPRPAAAGVRRRTASSRSSGPRPCCPASPTRGRCAMSARWPASTRWRRRRPPARPSAGGASRPSASVSPPGEARLPVDAVARGAPDRALVLGPRNDVTEVRLTPAHERSPWLEMLGPSHGHDMTEAGPAESEPPGLGR